MAPRLLAALPLLLLWAAAAQGWNNKYCGKCPTDSNSPEATGPAGKPSDG